jgi:mannose-6-phosphate isomerase-like protein (cupin superfamily)
MSSMLGFGGVALIHFGVLDGAVTVHTRRDGAGSIDPDAVDAPSGREARGLPIAGAPAHDEPVHSHQLEDEVFFVLSGRGVLGYGENVREPVAELQLPASALLDP